MGFKPLISKMAEVLTPPEGQNSFSGIPKAEFVEDVDSYMKGEDSAETKLKELDEMHQKYKFMETNLMARKRRLKGQLPDISSSLALIDKVCLWLGANVMLEYSLDDAEDLLKKNKVSAEKNILQINFDLGYLRDQMTITEVTMARLYD